MTVLIALGFLVLAGLLLGPALIESSARHSRYKKLEDEADGGPNSTT